MKPSPTIKLAIQKSGRLTEDTVDFLQKSGLDFERYNRRLLAKCRNFPLEILFVRDDDIPDYVSNGVADLGIIGQNVLTESEVSVHTILDLKFGFCSLAVAVPKESSYKSVKNLKNKRIATSYSNSVKKYFKQNGIPVSLVPLNGSVEIAPSLGIADAIVDLVSSGSSLAMNDLRVLEKISESQAVLIGNTVSLQDKNKELLIERLLMRFKAVLKAKNYKYIMMNAPENILTELKKTIPGLKSPTVSPLSTKGWISVQSVIEEDIFWETVEQLKKLGATGIIVLPIEKMIV